MDGQIFGRLLTTDSLYNQFITMVRNFGSLTPLQRQAIDFVAKFKDDNSRLPEWDEVSLRYGAIIPQKNGLPEETIRQALIELIEEEKIKSFIIKVADSIDKHSVNITEIFSDAEKLKEELAFKETPQKEPAPLSLSAFLQQDIPPVEYWVEGILQKEGRTMISASMNIGKSFFLQNLALAIANGEPQFLGRFKIMPARVLYLDLEMGQPALRERFLKMANGKGADNLFIKYRPAFDFLDSADQRLLEGWLKDLKPDALIVDPLSNASAIDENSAQEVHRVTAYLDPLRAKYKIALLLAHHWKKKSKDLRRGGEMASGSYRWGAWLDIHLCLEGNIDNVTLTCEKARNCVRFSPFMIRFNPETLTFEFLGDFSKKYSEETLVSLFNRADIDKIGRVAIADLIKFANGTPSKTTLHRLIDESTLFIKESAGQRKRAYLIKKDIKSPDLFDSMSQRGNGTDLEIENE